MSKDLSTIDLKELLNSMAEHFNVPAFVENDPVQFPRKYTLKQDIEVSAFLTATITWGKRSMILQSASRMHRIMGSSPFDYVMSGGYEKLSDKNIHRTFFEHDMQYICRGLRAVFQQYDSCEHLFSSLPHGADRTWKGISVFRECIREANENHERGLKHISDPRTSACKRLHLALRWLVRNDGIVDIGLWKNLLPSELKIPLDTHVTRIGRMLGLLQRTQNDRKAVDEITTNLLQFNPADPTLYDFALFGVGESGMLDDFV